MPAQIEIEREGGKPSDWKFQMQDVNNDLVLSFHRHTKSFQVKKSLNKQKKWLFAKIEMQTGNSTVNVDISISLKSH